MNFAIALAALVLISGSVTAQIPSGNFVVSAISSSNGTPGGLTIVHPTGAVPATPITGLPGELTGFGIVGNVGANCVIDSTDGFLIAGELAPNFGTVSIHQMIIVGGALIFDQVVPVGTGSVPATIQPMISQMAMLANGNVLFATAGLDNTGPLGGASFGLLDRGSQSITPIPVAMPNGTLNGMAVDEAAGTIYFGMFSTNGIWSVPMAGGTPTFIAPAGGLFWNMSLDQDGNLLVASGTSVKRIDVATGVYLETLTGSFGNVGGIAIERPTATVIGVPGSGSANVSRFEPGGATLIETISGHPSGITIIDTVSEYGVATPGATDYSFRTFPGVGGLPVAGNGNYAVQIDAANGNNNLGVLVASFGQTLLPVLGIQLLVDPNSAVALGPFPAGSAIPFPLPPGLPETPVFLQSVHLDAGNSSGLAASRGLLIITIQ